MNRRFSLLALLMAFAVVFGLATPAHASYSVQVFDDHVLQGGVTVVVSGNSLVFTGSTTHFSITNGSGLSNNPGTQTNSNLSLSSNEQINTTFGSAGGTHTIEIQLSQTGWTAPVGSPLVLSSSVGGSSGATLGAGDSVSASYQGFLDNTNTLFGEPAGAGTPVQTASASTVLGGTLPLVFAPGTAASLVPGGTPFSLTDDLTFTFTVAAGGGQDTANAAATTVATVPEPGSMLLFGTGLSGVAAMLRRRTKNQ